MLVFGACQTCHLKFPINLIETHSDIRAELSMQVRSPRRVYDDLMMMGSSEINRFAKMVDLRMIFLKLPKLIVSFMTMIVLKCFMKNEKFLNKYSSSGSSLRISGKWYLLGRRQSMMVATM